VRRSRLLALVVAAAAAMSLPLAAPAAADAAYGAIAVNRNTGATGISFNYSTLRGARRRALNECTGNCRVLVWVRNQCAAVVETPTRYVAGIGSTRRRAVRNARQRANNRTAKRRAWVCSG
jgi:hypothetical protein